MINAMLVLLTGGSGDAAVCSTAATIGRRLQAHLECHHPRFRAAEVALTAPHTGWVMGSAVAEMLAEIDEDSKRRAEAARESFTDLCRRERIPVVRAPRAGLFSAGWLDRQPDSVDGLIASARYRDLVVAGRTRSGYGLPSDFLDQLVLGCGRPVLVAPDRFSCPHPETIMVWWKENAHSARALAAALPLLVRAKRVIVTTAKEESRNDCDLSELVDVLCQHEIAAEANVLAEARDSTAHCLVAAAEHHAADLIVMGAYGHAHTREMVFGGVTQAALDSADLPILIVH